MFHAFPRFPQGLVGLGLLAARLAGAVQVLTCCLTLAPPPVWRAVAFLVCLALVAGLLARWAALLLALMIAVLATRTVGPLAGVLASSGLQLSALVLTGPGAYALDAYLFGRRVIRVGPRHTSV